MEIDWVNIDTGEIEEQRDIIRDHLTKLIAKLPIRLSVHLHYLDDVVAERFEEILEEIGENQPRT